MATRMMVVGKSHSGWLDVQQSPCSGISLSSCRSLLLIQLCMQALFVRQWLTMQRQHLVEWGPDQFDAADIMQRRSDQVRE